MFRDSLQPAAHNVFLALHANFGPSVYEMQYRSQSAPDSAVAVWGGAQSAPVWFKLVRQGNTFTGFISTNGQFWSGPIGSVTVPMNLQILAGVAISAETISPHNSTHALATVEELSVESLDLEVFRSCVATSAPGSACYLAPKFNPFTYSYEPYLVYRPIEILRSPLLIMGSSGSFQQTVLKRAAGACPIQIMDVSAPNLSGTTIQYLTFDGNRTDCVRIPLELLLHSELNLEPSLGTSNFTVQNVQFLNSPNNGLVPGRNSTLRWSLFSSNRISGVHVPGDAPGVWIYSNNFYFAGTGGLDTSGSQSWVYYNYLFDNHREFSLGHVGGQLLIGGSSSGATVQYNYIDGNNRRAFSLFSVGIEGYGSGHIIGPNWIRNHVAHGMSLAGLTSSEIRGFGFQGGDVDIIKGSDTFCPPEGCYGVVVSAFEPFRNVSNVTIHDLKIQSPYAGAPFSYGIGIKNEITGPPPNTFQSVSVTNNAITGANGGLCEKNAATALTASNNTFNGNSVSPPWPTCP